MLNSSLSANAVRRLMQLANRTAARTTATTSNCAIRSALPRANPLLTHGSPVRGAAAPSALSWRARRWLSSSAAAETATVPSDRKYQKSHEWIKVEGDVGTVGITAHAAAQLGDIVFVDLPEVGTRLDKKATFGAVESVKAASDVYTPAGGEVVEVNAELADDPSRVNKDPHGDGWMMRLRLSDPKEVEELMDQDAYVKFVETEEKH
ncbi:hypothetical protein CDCA_CDCA02G0737 [Cyanidium caldarium]|uniref:Glycine cleavage system H protein n=1 Tax=Cyanidium caldarium TaxID=2771 RepID=A0AAV9IR41_CYACA|nr:hypothetical protein CDCA_CDCA02G0737 [Cyanidium caldarium]